VNVVPLRGGTKCSLSGDSRVQSAFLLSVLYPKEFKIMARTSDVGVSRL
jgi:hypothetical protein